MNKSSNLNRLKKLIAPTLVSLILLYGLVASASLLVKLDEIRRLNQQIKDLKNSHTNKTNGDEEPTKPAIIGNPLSEFPLCSAIDTSEPYYTESILTTVDGQIYLFVSEGYDGDINRDAYITNCRYPLVKEKNDLFSIAKGKYSPISYYPNLQILEIYDSGPEAVIPFSFYNVKTATVLTPVLPAIKSSDAAWERTLYSDDLYTYFLIYPVIHGGCGMEKESSECINQMKKKISETYTQNSLYLFRSDNKLVRLADTVPGQDVSIEFDFDLGEYEGEPEIKEQYVKVLLDGKAIKKLAFSSLFPK